ncbi:hypothetical protein V496_02874 [Pseudogymnoascus sp. VKM F-4515 (FW-2607)]|nr:hypothetical protein V496_02874 [Pseudogymnoascus sp. VKM F-4515 (FW-2607)]
MVLVRSAVIALGLSVAQAHYAYPGILYNGQRSANWQYVRQTIERYNKAPVEDVMIDAIRCAQDPAGPTVQTLTVSAGTKLTFVTDGGLYHPGALQFYMAKVPQGSTAATWDGSGAHWFKVYQDDVKILNGQAQWPSLGADPSVHLPASLPNGEYLVRVEHIAVHVAYALNGAQFYIACAQINVTGGGNGTPGPLVSFPGAYSPTDPGILFNMYSPQTSYINPGPTVWSG